MEGRDGADRVFDLRTCLKREGLCIVVFHGLRFGYFC